VTSTESGKLSYIRAFREVVPSESLRLFLKSAHELVDEESFDTRKAKEAEPLVYAANSLRFTLFERRVQASQQVNDLLRKVDSYVQAPFHYTQKRTRSWPGGPLVTTRGRRENHLPVALRDIQELYVPGEEQLFVRSASIVDCTRSDFRHLGTELGLEIDAGSVADMLEAQSNLMYEAALRPVAGKRLPPVTEPDNPRVLPFMRAPFATDATRDVFVEILNAELPVYDIGVAPIIYRSNIIEV
jgi:hypothetical protein